MSSCDASFSPLLQENFSRARTTVITLLKPYRMVFNFLADIENLPRWAGGFCESLWLGQGRWMGLTSLGELFLELEADAPAGKIIFSAGWESEILCRLPLKIIAFSEESTGVKFALDAGADSHQERLYAAFETELRELPMRFAPELLVARG